MEILVPELGESVVEATVARWLKQKGDPVEVGEPVVELETDKVDLEVGAKTSGILAEIKHAEGDDVQVGEVLGVIDPQGEAAPAEEAPQSERQTAAEAEPAEATPEPARAEQTAAQAKPQAAQPDGANAVERATPVARRMAQERQVDLSQLEGSGPGQRITKEDVQRYLEQRPQPQEDTTKAPQPAQPSARSAAPTPTGERTVEQAAGAKEISAERPEVRQRMSRRRRTIASRLLEAQHNAAMLTTFNDVDMSAIMELRARRKESFQERHGIKLGIMSFFVKAVVGALKQFPRLNAEIDGDEVVLKYYYDIGIAIGAEEGLVVPVLRNADRKTFAEIERGIMDFVEKSRQGNLSIEDLRGGTFSITNGGVYGSLLSTPILNPPQVAILGMHRIEDRPVAVDGQVVIRPMMYLALSYDHRIVDGREAVSFLVRLKELLEDPESLLLEG